MGLFNFEKKKEEQGSACACNAPVEEKKKESCCCCGSNPADAETENGCCNGAGGSLVSIKVLGSGCKSCHELYENTKEAVKNAGLSVEVEYITDLEKVMGYGVMSMPGLVVNEKVVSMGKVLKAADVEKLLHKLGY
ncbi:MAG: thioredoxin family protein [Clostridiales bacterium]|nr:thioredoxin family protein [Clostridiales bacterium]